MNLENKVNVFAVVWDNVWYPINNFVFDNVKPFISTYIKKSVQNPIRDSVIPDRNIIYLKLKDYEFNR